MKRMTRRQVTSRLMPIRKCLREMRSGEIDAVRGYPVTRMHDRDDYVRVDYCIAGFRGLIERLFPDAESKHLSVIEKKLANGIPLDVSEIDAALAFLSWLEKPLMAQKVEHVISQVKTEQIAIEFDALGIAI